MITGWRKAAAIVLSAAIGCGLVTGCGKKDAAVDGTKTLLTVNGESVSLGMGSFLARYNQAEIYQIYSSYFGMTSNIFDTVTDAESNKTYGQTIKDNTLQSLENLLVLRQHAGDYDVSVSDEQKAAIADAAKKVMEANNEEVLKKIGVSQADLEELLTLQTIRSAMMDPMVVDVDTNITDEEAQQSAVTYIRVNVEDEASVSSGAESVAEAPAAASAASAAEAPAAAETAELPASGAESAPEEVELTQEQVAAQAKAQSVIDAIVAAGNVADADLAEIAKGIDSELSSFSGQFSTFNTSDGTVDASVAEAASGLKDGELCDHPVLSTDGTAYYVVRMDRVKDEGLTETVRARLLSERKQTLFDDTVAGWVEEAEIKVDEKAWNAIELTDAAPFTLTVPAQSAATDSTAESAAESVAAVTEVESVAEAGSVVSEVASAASEAASAAVSAAASAASDAAGTTSETQSAAA